MIPSISASRASSISGRCSGSGLALDAAAAGVVEDLLRQQPDQPGRRCRRRRASAGTAAARRRRTPAGRRRPSRRSRRAVLVELGDDDGARHADGGALLPEHLGRAVDAVDGGHDEQRGVGGAQPGAQVADEVGVAGGVEQVDLDAVVLERRQREGDRALLAVLGLVEVADRRAVLDPSGPGDGPGRDEQGLDQRRLARSGVADQHDVADLSGWSAAGALPAAPAALSFSAIDVGLPRSVTRTVLPARDAVAARRFPGDPPHAGDAHRTESRTEDGTAGHELGDRPAGPRTPSPMRIGRRCSTRLAGVDAPPRPGRARAAPRWRHPGRRHPDRHARRRRRRARVLSRAGSSSSGTRRHHRFVFSDLLDGTMARMSGRQGRGAPCSTPRSTGSATRASSAGCSLVRRRRRRRGPLLARRWSASSAARSSRTRRRGPRALGMTCNVGIAERAERLVVVLRRDGPGRAGRPVRPAGRRSGCSRSRPAVTVGQRVLRRPPAGCTRPEDAP